MSRRSHRARLERLERAPKARQPQPGAPEQGRSSGANRPLHIPLVVAALFVGALVVELFPLSECESDLGFPASEIKLERNQRQALTLDGTDHFPDLLPMKQQLPRPGRLVVEVARLFIGRYVK